MSDNLPKNMGEKAERFMSAALAEGVLVVGTEGDMKTCRNLNSRGLLRRHPKDANIWYPSEKAYELSGVESRAPDDPPSAPDSSVLPVARTLMDIPLNQIDIGFRLRPADAAKVETLKASFSELGHRTPISVTPRAGSERYLLSAGLHRLEAARALDWTHILSFVEPGDDLDAELWEIDENLCRAELTPADKALFTFRRKQIYLLKNPETAQHVAGGRARQHGATDKLSFAVATAEATGTDVRTVRRDAERGEKISERALRMLRGTAADKGTVLDKLKRLPEEMQIVMAEAELAEIRRKKAEAKEIRDQQRATARQVRGAVLKAIADRGTVATGAMPRAAFPIIYADPAWEQEAWSDQRGQDRGLPYPHMPLNEIKALCAEDKSPATRDAILLLWVTANRLDDGIDVLRAWGFDYVSCLVWDKVHIGMGRWVRDRHEILMIGKRGDFPAPLPGSQSPSIYAETKGEHSAKPVYFAEMIERLYPDLPKLELFQRRDSLAPDDVRLKGNWTFWGNQAGAPEGEAP